MDIQIRRFKNRKTFKSGTLLSAIYFETNRITSGLEIIPPGGISDLEPGHQDAEEVFTVSKGSMVVKFPDMDKEYELGVGDAILIPAGEPHIVKNQGDEEAIVVFSAAPHL